MQGRRTGLAALVGAFAALSAAADAGAQVVSPGPLSRFHAELDGAGNCDRCHLPGKGRAEPRACLDCHEVLRDRIAGRAGFHGREGRTDCGRCHQEHRGRGFDIVRWPGGAAAEAFAHHRAGWRLRGAHARTGCRDCHASAYQREPRVQRFDPRRRARTYLGLDTACGACHVDEHDGRLGDRCESCHGETEFAPAARFDHDASAFPLRGEHRDVDCDDCHVEVGRTPERLFKGLAFADCASCHDDPHRGAMTPTKATTTRGRTPGDAPACRDCHDETAWSKLRYDRKTHAPRRFALAGGHAEPACGACHGERVDRLPDAACASCHQDPHRGRFGARCADCHGVANWRARPRSAPPPGTAARATASLAARLGLSPRARRKTAFHDATRYPLTGLHVTVACAACHPRARKGYQRYRGLRFASCSDCHADVHQGAMPGDCADCHATAGWPRVRFGVAEHAQTPYPLTGAHRATPCDGCHPRATAIAERFAIAGPACEACHDDPHGGQFADLAVGTACADCHATDRFRPASAFDHDATRLPLEGRHAATACGSCHRAPAADAPVSYRGIGARCGDCHRDPHAGQFTASEPARDCGVCHDAEGFGVEPRGFDHATIARYPLTGGHAGRRCDDCHHEVRLRSGRKIPLYRLGSRACGDCHAAQHQARDRRLRPAARPSALAPARAGATDLDACGRCHSVDRWGELVPISDFDHATVGYRLRGAHAVASCAQCHTAVGAPTALTDACAGCHADPHDGVMGAECGECHSTRTWAPDAMLARHQGTRLPLTGQHALADCTSCHPRADAGGYAGTPVACIGCHRAEYDDPATHPAHQSAGFGTRCDECHRPAGWSPAYFAHTSFPLEGLHRSASCASCHEREPVPQTCAGCHDADLDAATAPDHRALGFTTACERCHTARGWSPAAFPEHDALFPITRGDHAGFDCADCHPDPTDSRVFTCTGACHPRARMDDEHDEVGGYLYDDRACLMCHPDGDEG